MGFRRKIDDEADARRCLSAAKRAGKSAGEWACSQGIDGRSLHAWSVNLQRARTPGRARLLRTVRRLRTTAIPP